MALKQDIATDLAANQFSTDDFATAITYNGVAISGVLDDIRRQEVDGNVIELAELEVNKSDVAQPAYRDPVIISGTTWHVREWTGDDFSWKITLAKDERPVI